MRNLTAVAKQQLKDDTGWTTRVLRDLSGSCCKGALRPALAGSQRLPSTQTLSKAFPPSLAPETWGRNGNHSGKLVNAFKITAASCSLRARNPKPCELRRGRAAAGLPDPHTASVTEQALGKWAASTSLQSLHRQSQIRAPGMRAPESAWYTSTEKQDE